MQRRLSECKVIRFVLCLDALTSTTRSIVIQSGRTKDGEERKKKLEKIMMMMMTDDLVSRCLL